MGSFEIQRIVLHMRSIFDFEKRTRTLIKSKRIKSTAFYHQIIAFVYSFFSILRYIALRNVGSLKSHIRHQTTLQGKEDLSSKCWDCTNGRTCLLLKYSSMIAKSMPPRFLTKRHSRGNGAPGL